MEWTLYTTSARALLYEHPRTTYIGGITCFDIVEVYLPERTVRQLDFVQRIPPPPLRPTQALRPAQGTHSVTFASTSIYMEAWSRFPYCARIGDQVLSRASVPSEAVREYVDWFKVCSHPYLLPGEGPSAGYDAADSRVEFVSFIIYVFPFICLLNGVCCVVKTVILCVQFANEFPSRIAPLLRMPPIVHVTHRERQTADFVVEKVRDLYAEWQAF